ncbi:unnamed protein product [Allacma fusca]|uniref:C2H2-type domain-containing protein n=1 Tax=Allacma fusca TaxID=39272 RepID=A0A8J2LV29_9HEXA|nr:unnamed protein product [Allacma fusca]
MSNLVWTKLTGSVWWVGEKQEESPEESSKSPKKEVQVVKFFDGTLHSVSNPKFIVEYEANKEEHIRSGLKLLKKKESMRKEFITDVTEAEKRSGGDENIVEKYSEPVNTTPRKSVVSQIFKTDVVEKKPTLPATPVTPANAGKSAKKNQSPRRSRGPTPQIANDPMKYVCPQCNYSTNRVNVLTLHMKSHTSDSITSPRAQKAAHKTVIPTPEKPSSSRSARQAVKTSPKVVTPKRNATPKSGAGRKSVKRKVTATPKEIAKEEILADWSDAEEESQQKEKKKAKTSQDIFDTLLQKTQSPSSEPGEDKTQNATTDLITVTPKDEPDVDQMDIEEMPTLSNNNTPVSELISATDGGSESISATAGDSELISAIADDAELISATAGNAEVSELISATTETSQEVEEKDDLDAKFNELMKETTVTLPSFSSSSKCAPLSETTTNSITQQSNDVEVKPPTEKCKDTKDMLSANEEVRTEKDSSHEKPVINESELKTENDEAPSATDSVVETNVEDVVKTLPIEEPVTECEKTTVNDIPEPMPMKLENSSPPDILKSPVKVQQPQPVTEKVLPCSAISKPLSEGSASSASTATPSAPVYAKKSVPQLIEEKPKPKRTYSPRRRPSAAKSKASDTDTRVEPEVETKPKITQNNVSLAALIPESTDAKSQLRAEIQNPISCVPVSSPRKRETLSTATASTPAISATPTTTQSSAKTVLPNSTVKVATQSAVQVAEPVLDKPVAAVVKPKTSSTEPPKPVSPTKAVPSTPRGSQSKSSRKTSSEVTKPAIAGGLQTEVEGTKGLTQPVIQQQYLITSATGAVIATDPIPSAPVALAVETIRKPPSIAACSPTASSLALAQRKKEPNTATPKARGRTYPGRKSQPGSSEMTAGKPTATVKPTVNVEEDSIIRQALQVQKGTIKSSPPTEQKRDTPVEQVVHVVPVQNPDGSVSYMFLSLNESDELKLDQLEGPTPTNNLEAVYIDKTVDCETLMTTLNPQQPQQIQLQLPQTFSSSQASLRQQPVSQQVKQQIAATTAIASPSSSQSQFISETIVAPQQFVIQQDGQEILNIGSNTIVQNEDGSFMDFSQLSSGDNNIYFMTEDGSIIDPAQCGMTGADIQQFLGSQ